MSTFPPEHHWWAHTSPGPILPALPALIPALCPTSPQGSPSSGKCPQPCPGHSPALPMWAQSRSICFPLLQPGQDPLAASCEGDNFMYRGSFSRESGELGDSRGRGRGPCPGKGEWGRAGPRRCRGKGGRFLLLLSLGHGEAGRSLRNTWPGTAAVEGCQGLFWESWLVVRSQGRGNTNPGLLAQPGCP